MGVGKTTFTFSKSSISVDGGSTNINLTRDNQSYTNKLSHGYGDIYTFPAGATDYTWAPTAEQLKSFFQETPSQKIRPIDVYLDTYNGSTKVGRDTHTLQVALSEATGKPTISNFAITDSNSAASSMGIIVVGKSSLNAVATPTAKYGASIVKSQFMYGKKTSGTSAFTNGGFLDIDSLVESLPLTETPTDYVIGYMVGDSRGFSSSASSVTKSLVRYQAPHIDNFEVVRRDASGNEDENGTKALVIVKGGWSAMRASGSTTDKNTATLKVGYKAASATSYTYQTISVTGGTIDVTQTLNATLAAGTDYVFSVQLADKFETYSESGVGCSNVQNILYVSADGNTLTIGSDVSNNVMIDPNGVSVRDGSTVNATFTKDKIELGKNSENAEISMRNDTLNISTNGAGDSAYTGLTVDGGLHIVSEGDNDRAVIQMYRDGAAGTQASYLNLVASKTYGTDVGSASLTLRGIYSSGYGSSSSAIDMRANAINIATNSLSGSLADWVVAQGKSGNWTYRKWASGWAECYGYGPTTARTTVALSGGKGYYDANLTGGMAFPFTFTSAPYCVVVVLDPTGYVWFVENAYATTTKAATGYFYSLVSHVSTVDVNYHVWGYWK